VRRRGKDPLDGVKAIAAGISHGLALREDGTVWVWGWNSRGQLGIGSYSSKQSAVQITALGTDNVSIGAGYQHSLAVKAGSGAVVAWGDNDKGQLGDGTTTGSNVPVAVSGLTGVAAVAGGNGHSLAVTTGGAVWAWGLSQHGQLGATGAHTCTFNSPCSKTPIRTGVIGGITTVAAGHYHSLALRDGPLTEADHWILALIKSLLHGTGGDPVETATGNFTYTRTDLAIAGRGPAPSFVRTYNSADARVGPLGPGWSYSYDVRLVKPADGGDALLLVGPDGRRDRYARNPDGTYAPPSQAVTTTLVHNADGTYTAAHKDRSAWTFDAGGRLTRIADRHGNASILTYNSKSQLTAVSDPAGRGSLTFAYDATTGRLTSVTDWTSRVVGFQYDGSGRLWKSTDRASQITTYGYQDATSWLATITDARGAVALTNHYDALGRVDWQKDARGLTTGQQTTFAYLDNGDGTRTTRVTHPVTSYEPTWNPVVEDTYDAQSRFTRRVTKPTSDSAEWTTVLHTYDADGFRTSSTDARNNTTLFCYDVGYDGAPIAGSRGNLTRTVAPAAAPGQARPVALISYDANDNVVQTVSPEGVASSSSTDCATDLSAAVDTDYATDLAYDAGGLKLLSTTKRFTDPDLGLRTATTQYEYTDAANPGLVTKVIPPRGNTGGTPDYTYATTHAYGASGSQAGMLLSTTDPLGNKSTFGYDAVGRRTSMVDPNGNATGGVPADHTWLSEYDAEDRLRFSRAPAPAAGGARLVTEHRYDAVGNRTETIDANGQVTQNVYDERDALFEVHQSKDAWTDPAVSPSTRVVTEYTYDHAGNLTRVLRGKFDTNAVRATDYAYDGAGRVRSETQYPDWPNTSPTLVATTTYDLNGNRATATDQLGRTTTFGYDALNRLTSVDYSDAGTADVSYAYDADGNRTSMTDGTGTTSYTLDELGRPTLVTSPGPKTVGYRYDLDGNRTKLVYPDATAVTYAYDKAGRPSGLTDWAARSVAYAFTPDGQLKTVANPNTTTATNAFDNARRLTQVHNQAASATVTLHTYTLDAAGTRTAVAESLAPVGGGSLTGNSVTYSYDKLYRLLGDGTRTYAYDPVGNRTSLTDGTTTAYTYDRADRVLTAGAVSYTVDANGNLVARGSEAFTYDQANRLTSATVGGSTTTYAYDGDGKRASSTLGGVTTTYTYDANRALPVVLEEGTRKYVWGAGGLGYTLDSVTSTISYGHADGLGSTRALTDATGAVTQRYDTDPFGVSTASTGNVAQPFRFTGEQRDGTGLYYLRARMYDPALGRFLTRDSYPGEIQNPSSLHRFAYVENNPVNLTDPSGNNPAVVQKLIELAGRVGPAATGFVQRAQRFFGGNSENVSKVLAHGYPTRTRALTEADLGVQGTVRQLSGTFSVSGPRATVRVDMIEGEIRNPLGVVQNLARLAREEGAEVLRLEGTIAYPRLLDVLARRYNVVTEGATDAFEIALR
jgi:RHS repeat-associated protein